MTKAQLIADHQRTIGIASERIVQLEGELAEASAERAEALSKLVVWETVTQPEGERLGLQLTAELEVAKAKLEELSATLDERDAAIDELTDELADTHRDRDAAETAKNDFSEDLVRALGANNRMQASADQSARDWRLAAEARDALKAQLDAERRVATETQAKLLKRAEDAEQAFTRVTHLTSENVQHWRARESALFDLVRHLASE